MKRIFKWIYPPSGNCPVQSEGYFMNYYFYFRARGSRATIEFYKNQDDYENFWGEREVYFKVLKETEPFFAGWLSQTECKILILKGCLSFLLYNMFKKNPEIKSDL